MGFRIRSRDVQAQSVGKEHTSAARGGDLLASEGLALILGSAEVGNSAVVGAMSADPVESNFFF